MDQPEVLIIGGGPAGLSAAIAAARLGARVTLLEAGARVGRKILASGNGRCNLTNTGVSPAAYNHPEFVEPILGMYSYEGILSFFEGMGLLTQVEGEGRVYPETNVANSVLDVMRLECTRLGVEVRCDFEVARVAKLPGPGGFEVSSKGGETVCADTVVVATGGGGSLLTELGHGMVECVPVLGPIKTDTEPIRGLSGTRVSCAASILTDEGEPVATERGELLFRDYGVSGIMVFDLSRSLHKGRVLSIDFFPDVAPRDMLAMISDRCDALPWRTAGSFFDGMLHSRVAQAVIRAEKLDPKTPVAKLPREHLAMLLKDFRLTITGRGDARQAQVTRGGATVDEFDATTLHSRRVAGLFAAGEVLDIDGRCGGFNLHWAWASGIVAGQSAARRVASGSGGPNAPAGDSA